MNHLEKIIAGLQIVAKYGKEYDVAAEHDTIYAGVESADKMTDEDKQAMKDAGWGWNDGLGCFYFFV